MANTEAEYDGRDLPGDVTILVSQIRKRMVWVGQKPNSVQEGRWTANGVPLTRLSGPGIVCGKYETDVAIDIGDEAVTTVRVGQVVIASDHGVVVFDGSAEWGGKSFVTLAQKIQVSATAKEVLEAGILAISTRTTTPRKETA